MDNNNELSSQMKSVSMVDAVFTLLSEGDELTAVNKRRKAFLETIPGMFFPDDWDELDEDVKKERLDKAHKQLNKRKEIK